MKTILLAGLAICAAHAQSLSEPPALMRFQRIAGTASVRAYADARIPVEVVGLQAIAGPAETWLIEVHDSFAGIEDMDKALHPVEDTVEGTIRLIGVYRPGLSYRPEQAIQTLRKARYCQVSIYRVRPGSEADFGELVKSRRIVFDSINLDRPDVAYSIVAGGESGTFVFLAPMTSLKVLDEGMAKAPAYAENVAAGSSKTAGIAREHLLLRVEPGLSWVSDDFASADAEFWRGKAKTP